MLILPVVVACSTLTPPAEISAIHFTAHYQYAIAACTEIPYPDHALGGLSVNSITGGPNELSPIQQVDFTVPVLMPLRTPERAPDTLNRRIKAQTRGLGQAYRPRPASKRRGRG